MSVIGCWLIIDLLFTNCSLLIRCDCCYLRSWYRTRKMPVLRRWSFSMIVVTMVTILVIFTIRSLLNSRSANTDNQD